MISKLECRTQAEQPRPMGTLNVTRQPGELGPMLSCRGPLTVLTAEALRRELAQLIPLGHPVLTIDLTRCEAIDAYGGIALVDALQQLRERGGRLVLVAGTPASAGALRALRIAEVVPVYPNLETATGAARGSAAPPLPPATWLEAQRATLGRWRAIRALFGIIPVEETAREVTSMFPLCEQAEEVGRECGKAGASRCTCCPVFHALGARQADVGCRSLLQPILVALREGDEETARVLLDDAIATVATAWLPPGGGLPEVWPPS
jgi:anti-anti-sigma regulatory factor